METVIKGFLSVFIFAMITWLCVGIISAEMDSSMARSYMDNAKKEIAESNFSAAVIEEVGEKAAENGYKMDITIYGRGSGKQEVHYGKSGNGSVGDTSKTDCVELVMKYPYSIPILKVKEEHTVRGYVN